jgi:hypothetical protein
VSLTFHGRDDTGSSTNSSFHSFFRRRKRYNAVGRPAAPMLAEPYTGLNDYTNQIHDSKSPNENIAEIQR